MFNRNWSGFFLTITLKCETDKNQHCMVTILCINAQTLILSNLAALENFKHNYLEIHLDLACGHFHRRCNCAHLILTENIATC